VTKGRKAGSEHHIATDDVVGLTATIDAKNDTGSFKLKGGSVGGERTNVTGAKWGRQQVGTIGDSRGYGSNITMLKDKLVAIR
jgi:hypothetical protein